MFMVKQIPFNHNHVEDSLPFWGLAARRGDLSLPEGGGDEWAARMASRWADEGGIARMI